MTDRCDACGIVLWNKPHVMLISSSPAMVGNRLALCDSCYYKMLAVQKVVNQNIGNLRMVKDDAGTATVCSQVD